MIWEISRLALGSPRDLPRFRIKKLSPVKEENKCVDVANSIDILCCIIATFSIFKRKVQSRASMNLYIFLLFFVFDLANFDPKFDYDEKLKKELFEFLR